MALWFDANRHAYRGDWVTVDADLFEEAVAELIVGGASEADARRHLLNEAEWVNVEDAALTDSERLCLHCRAPLSSGRQFCDVVCEAAFIVEVHQ